MIKKILSIAIFLCLFTAAADAAKTTYRVQVIGVTGDARENIESRINSTLPAYPDLDAKTIAYLKTRLPNEAAEALKPYGYFHATINLNIQATSITLHVVPGNKMRVKAVQLLLTGEGKDNTALKTYFDHFPIRAGKPLETLAYEKAKEKTFTLANAHGYIKAHYVTSQIVVDLANNRATIILHFDTGPRYYLGKITIKNNPYSAALVERMLNFQEDEPYSSSRLMDNQQALLNSFYFDNVLVVPQLNNISNNRIPIDLNLIAPKAKVYSIGVGYGTLTGPRLTAGLKLNRLTNSGQHAEAQLKLSSVLSSISVKYAIPGYNPLTDQWVLGANFVQFNPENGRSQSGTVQAGYTKAFGNLKLEGFVNYLVEKYQLKDEEKHFSKLLYPNLSLNYVQVDDPIKTNHGLALNAKLLGASEALLSSTSFVQGQVGVKYLFSPTRMSRILLKSSLGYTIVSDRDNLPLSMFFWAGGPNSIRGYKDSSIGPGRYLGLASAEIRHRIIGNWVSAVFYDAGTATNHFKGPIYQSTGVGVIYESMIGPVRVYLAHALNKDHKPLSLELSIGPEF